VLPVLPHPVRTRAAVATAMASDDLVFTDNSLRRSWAS
jgi:hypothetical protein